MALQGPCREETQLMRRTDQRLEYIFSSILKPFRSAAVCSSNQGILQLKSSTLVDTGTLGVAAEAVAKYITPKVGETVITNDPGCGSALWSDMTFVTALSFGTFGKKEATDSYFVSRLRLRPRLKNLETSQILRLPPFVLPKGHEEEILKSIAEQPQTPKEFLTASLPHLEQHLTAARSLTELVGGALRDQKKYSWESFIENSRQMHLKRLEDLPLGQFKIQRDLGQWGRVCLEIQNSAKGALFNFEGTEIHTDLSLTSPMTSGVCLTALNSFFRIRHPISIGHFQNLTVQTPMRSALDGKISNLTPMGPLVFANILANTIVELLARSVKSLSVGEPGFTLAVSCIFEDGQVLYESMPGGSGGSPNISGQDGIDVWTRLSLQPSIEDLEKNFPVTVERHEKRSHSGGRGQFGGGDGLRRTLKFQKPAKVSWLPTMVKMKADGFLGGSQGDSCLLTLVRASGEEIANLPAEFDVYEGDKLTMLSGGGGGFGRAET